MAHKACTIWLLPTGSTSSSTIFLSFPPSHTSHPVLKHPTIVSTWGSLQMFSLVTFLLAHSFSSVRSHLRCHFYLKWSPLIFFIALKYPKLSQFACLVAFFSISPDHDSKNLFFTLRTVPNTWMKKYLLKELYWVISVEHLHWACEVSWCF